MPILHADALFKTSHRMFFTAWSPCPDQLGLDPGPDFLGMNNVTYTSQFYKKLEVKKYLCHP